MVLPQVVGLHRKNSGLVREAEGHHRIVPVGAHLGVCNKMAVPAQTAGREGVGIEPRVVLTRPVQIMIPASRKNIVRN